MYDRQFARVPFSVEVEYRTQGNFLVAYSVNLSTGGMFVETTRPQPVGTQLSMRFSVPGVGVAHIEGVVAWVRHEASATEPIGMGIRFTTTPDASLGALIDRLAQGFRGLKVLVVATSDSRRSLLARAVRSVLATATVVEVRDSERAEAELAADPDLVMVDLEDEVGEALAALRSAKHRGSPLPVIAVGSAPEARQRAVDLGADEVLAAQPAANDLQGAVMRALGRPSNVR